MQTYMKSAEEAHNFPHDARRKNWENSLAIPHNLISEHGGVLCFCFDYNCPVTSYESETTANIMSTKYRDNKIENDLWTKADPLRRDVS